MTVFTLVLTASAFTQDHRHKLPNDPDKLEDIAQELVFYHNYKRALHYYLKLDSLAEGAEPEYRFKVAQCYIQTSAHKAKAVEYLVAIAEHKDDFDEDYWYYLGKAYHYDYQFDKAISTLKRFLNEARRRDDRRSEVKHIIRHCQHAKVLVQETVDVTIRNLGPNVNTPFMEHTPVVSADEAVLIFTSQRPGSTGGRQTTTGRQDTLVGQYLEDIYVSFNIGGDWTKATPIGGNINSTVHDAAVGLSSDGQQLFIYRSDSIRYGNIFVCRQEGDKWGNPQKLPAPINTAYWESSSSITPDGNIIYFASNRPGGEGEKDLYRARRLPNGQWAEPEHLGDMVNTPYDEDAPFIHPDGRTLYFSSKGHNSMGGFDIFVSKLDETGKWSKPVNLGYPINSPDNDLSFVLSADGTHGYYAAAKKDSYGDLDLYMVEMPAEVEAITLLKGFIRSACKDTRLNDAQIQIHAYDPSADTIGELVAINRPGSNTGKYLIILEKGRDYRVTIEASGHNTQEIMFSLPADEAYAEIDTNYVLTCTEETRAKMTEYANRSVAQRLDNELRYIYFDIDKAELTKEAIEKLDTVARFMKKHPEVNMLLKPHTDLIRASEYSVRLSESRAEAVYNFLLEQTVSAARLQIISPEAKEMEEADVEQVAPKPTHNRRITLIPVVQDNEN